MKRLKGQRVYLAGAMDRVVDRGKGWRQDITPFLESLEAVVFNPILKPTDIGLEDNTTHDHKTKLKKQNKKIAGYGAAAKGMTILKCSGIGKELSYFVDDSPAKQGLFSPVDHVPILSRKKAQKKLPDYFIILAPNYSEVIMSKEKNFIKNGGKFIVPKNGIHVLPT